MSNDCNNVLRGAKEEEEEEKEKITIAVTDEMAYLSLTSQPRFWF